MFQQWPTNMFTNSRHLPQISIHVANNVCNVHLYSQKIAVRINLVKHEKNRMRNVRSSCPIRLYPKDGDKKCFHPLFSKIRFLSRKQLRPSILVRTCPSCCPSTCGNHLEFVLPHLHSRARSKLQWQLTQKTTDPSKHHWGAKAAVACHYLGQAFFACILGGSHSAFLLSAHANSTKFLTEMRPESWSQGAAIWCEGRSSLKVWGFPFCLACFGFAVFFYKKAGPMKPRHHRQSSNQFRQSALPLPAHTMRHD